MADAFDELDAAPVDSGWLAAPSTSHVQQFRHVNRAFSGGGPSEIFIRFRPTKYKPAVVTYRYPFANHAEGHEIFLSLATDPHPGQVIDRELVKQGHRGEKVEG